MPDRFVEFDVNERGKTRHIKSPSIRDRVLQRAVCDYVLEPVLYSKLIYDNGASVKGKGVEFTRKRLDKHLRDYYREHGNKGYILVGDFRTISGNPRQFNYRDESVELCISAH